eukprot:351292-Chlamydomonas_euryale.AAC.4
MVSPKCGYGRTSARQVKRPPLQSLAETLGSRSVLNLSQALGWTKGQGNVQATGQKSPRPHSRPSHWPHTVPHPRTSLMGPARDTHRRGTHPAPAVRAGHAVRERRIHVARQARAWLRARVGQLHGDRVRRAECALLVGLGQATACGEAGVGCNATGCGRSSRLTSTQVCGVSNAPCWSALVRQRRIVWGVRWQQRDGHGKQAQGDANLATSCGCA